MKYSKNQPNNILTLFKKRYGMTEQEVQEHLETEEQFIIEQEFFWVQSIKRYLPLTLPNLSSAEDKRILQDYLNGSQ